MMSRDQMVRALASGPFDVIIIGGGATGLGTAIDAQTRGYRTLLLEQHDFAKGTSSRSTKLIHGGVRYLKQGNVALVLEALRERGRLYRNAPHLVRDLAFVVPRYRWWEGPFYGIGLKLYDRLAHQLSLAPSRRLGPAATVARIPNVETRHLLGGIVYHDAVFDDARTALALAQTAADHGAVLINYMPVQGLLTTDGVVSGVQAVDAESGQSFSIEGRVVVNAAGVFSDQVRALDDPDVSPMVVPSQGVHLVLDRSFLPGDTALMVPRTDDGRVLFAIPWYDRVLVGTTDTEMKTPELEPRPLEEEVTFILRNADRYLLKAPTEEDILSIFAGQRALVRGESSHRDSKFVNREHTIVVSRSGLVTIVGGKWTTYRQMGADVVEAAAGVGGLDPQPCATEDLRLHGAVARRTVEGEPEHERPYGADLPNLRAFIDEDPTHAELLHPRLPYVAGQVRWAARHEMARSVEDVLARRTRCLLLDARASMEAAPGVAGLLAQELDRDQQWIEAQIVAYLELARGYLPDGVT